MESVLDGGVVDNAGGEARGEGGEGAGGVRQEEKKFGVAVQDSVEDEAGDGLRFKIRLGSTTRKLAGRTMVVSTGNPIARART